MFSNIIQPKDQNTTKPSQPVATGQEKPNPSISLFSQPQDSKSSITIPSDNKSSLFNNESHENKDLNSSSLFSLKPEDKNKVISQSTIINPQINPLSVKEEKEKQKDNKDSLNPNLIEKLRQKIKSSLTLYSTESDFDSTTDQFSDSFIEFKHSLLNRKKQKNLSKFQLIKSEESNSIITLYIKFCDSGKEISFTVKIKEKASIKSLIEVIESHLIQDHFINIYHHSHSHSLFLMKNHTLISPHQSIHSNNIKNNDTLVAVLNTIEETKENVPKKEELAPENKLPKLTNKEYKTIPDMKEIYRMTSKQLAHVSSFRLFNQHGKIEFEDEIDLTEVDLDEIVEIGYGYIKVYKKTIDYPNPGEGLNKPAIVHMYNMLPNKEEKLENYLKKLQLKCKEMKAEFKSYNENTGELVYKIEHF